MKIQEETDHAVEKEEEEPLNQSIEVLLDDEKENNLMVHKMPQKSVEEDEKATPNGDGLCACATDKALRPFVIISSVRVRCFLLYMFSLYYLC